MSQIIWTQKYKILENRHKKILNAEDDHGIATTAGTEGRINWNTYGFSMEHAQDNDMPAYVYKTHFITFANQVKSVDFNIDTN